jgi:hypothetical protein
MFSFFKRKKTVEIDADELQALRIKAGMVDEVVQMLEDFKDSHGEFYVNTELILNQYRPKP